MPWPFTHGSSAGEPTPGSSWGERADPDETDTWRSRALDAASHRSIPLGTIVVAVVVAVGVVDANVLLVILAWTLRTEILYVIVGGFVALLLSPAVHVFERRGMARGLAATLVFLAALVIFVGLVTVFTVPLVNSLGHLPKQLDKLVDQARHGKGWIGHLVTRFHLQKWVHQNVNKFVGDLTRVLKPAQAFSVGAAAFGTLISLTTIAVLAFFILLEGPNMWHGFLRLLRPVRAARFERVFQEAARSVTGYMFGNIMTSLIAGVVVFITLSVLGVPFALLLGLWVALVDLLPLVGGLIAGIPTVAIAFLHSPVAGVVTFAVFIIYQQIENHILNPVVMSRTVRLNPLWVLLAVLIGAKLGDVVGGALGAFVGALIGIPAGGALQVLVREIRRGPSPPASTGDGAPAVGAGAAPAPDPGAGPATP
jgi:predicted PurR-regulated permease PerM